jgi:hypothetical protein
MSVQLDAAGRLRHLLTLDGLPAPIVLGLLERARGFVTAPPARPPRGRQLEGRTVANLFLEPSTRTRVSFELAARRLGADVVNIEGAAASTVKGETLLDTVYTLQSMHTDFFVIRTTESGAPASVAERVARRDVSRCESHVASDGTARRAHHRAAPRPGSPDRALATHSGGALGGTGAAPGWASCASSHRRSSCPDARSPRAPSAARKPTPASPTLMSSWQASRRSGCRGRGPERAPSASVTGSAGTASRWRAPTRS